MAESTTAHIPPVKETALLVPSKNESTSLLSPEGVLKPAVEEKIAQEAEDKKYFQKGLEEARETIKKLREEKWIMSSTQERLQREHEEMLRERNLNNRHLQSEVESKSKQLEDLKCQVDEHNRKTVEQSSLEDKILILQETNTALESKLSESQNAMQLIEAELSEIRIQKADLEQVLEQRLEQEGARHKNELGLWKAKIVNLEAESKEARDHAAELKSLSEQKVSSLQAEIERLSSELNEKGEIYSKQLQEYMLRAGSEIEDICKFHEKEKFHLEARINNLEERQAQDTEEKEKLSSNQKKTVADLNKYKLVVEKCESEASKLKERLQLTVNKNEVLLEQIETLKKSRDELKTNVVQLKNELVADHLCDEDDTKALEQETEDTNGRSLPMVQKKQKLMVSGDEESCEGKNIEHGDVKLLQAELDSAKSTMEQLSKNLSHHRKESNMLYIQVQAAEEQRSSHEAMQKTIAEQKDRNASLKNKLQGEAMLVSAIEVLQTQLAESKEKIEEFKQQLQAQSESHNGVVESMSIKLKDIPVLETRIRELQGQLHLYNKQESWLSKSIAKLEVDYTTTVWNLPPGYEEDQRVQGLLDALNKVEKDLLKEKESKLKLLKELKEAGVKRIGISLLTSIDQSQTTTTNIWPTIAECISFATDTHIWPTAVPEDNDSKFDEDLQSAVEVLEEKVIEQRALIETLQISSKKRTYSSAGGERKDTDGIFSLQSGLCKCDILTESEIMQSTKRKFEDELVQNDLEKHTTLDSDKPPDIIVQLLEDNKERGDNKVNANLIKQLKERLETPIEKTGHKDNHLHPKSASHSRSHSAHRVPVANSEESERQRDETPDAVVLARLEALMTIEVNRMREEVKAKAEKLHSKRQEVKNLRRKMEALQEEKNQKIGYMEDLIKEKEMALTHMREQSDLQIKNLRAQLAMKGSTIELERERVQEERERLEAETEGFRWKVLELERSESNDISRKVTELEEEVAQLTKDLAISREEALTACASKVQTVQRLAEEIERLRCNPCIFISFKRDISTTLPG